MKTELRPFQKEGVRAIWRFNGRALLADEMGLGKTIQSLDWIRRIHKYRPVIIVTPAAVKWTWHAEAHQHFGMDTAVIEGRRPPRVMTIPAEITIINYDLLESWLPALVEAKPKVLIFDEAHYLKSSGAQRTKAARELAEHAKSVLGLSGTPLTNRPIELWSILAIIRPDLFPSKSKFAWRFCRPRYTRWGWVYDGAMNIPELRRILLRECMIRRLKKDVLPELPDKEVCMVSFRMDPRDRKEYQKAETGFLDWLRKISPSRANRAKKSQALTRVGYLLRLATELKLAQSVEWVREFLRDHPTEKLVLLTMHTFVIEHFASKFPGTLVINGKVTGRKRQDTVKRFQNNPRSRLLVGNWKAAGVGLTLTASANLVAHDFPWTPGDFRQGGDRVHRIGQKRKVTIRCLRLMDTIDEKLINGLRKKDGVLNSVLDGGEEHGELDIFGDLIKGMIHA